MPADVLMFVLHLGQWSVTSPGPSQLVWNLLECLLWEGGHPNLLGMSSSKDPPP